MEKWAIREHLVSASSITPVPTPVYLGKSVSASRISTKIIKISYFLYSL